MGWFYFGELMSYGSYLMLSAKGCRVKLKRQGNWGFQFAELG